MILYIILIFDMTLCIIFIIYIILLCDFNGFSMFSFVFSPFFLFLYPLFVFCLIFYHRDLRLYDY